MISLDVLLIQWLIWFCLDIEHTFLFSFLLYWTMQMLIFLYSDRNYNLHGFDATYTIANCPFGCSGHGTCSDHSCVCDTGYHGDSCDRRSCPYECGYQWSAGSCQTTTVNYHNFVHVHESRFLKFIKTIVNFYGQRLLPLGNRELSI